MTTGRQRSLVAACVVVAMVMTTVAGDLLTTPDGASLWWLPTAVLVAYLPTDRAIVTLPVASVAWLCSGLVATGAARGALPLVAVSSITVVASYALALLLMDRVRGARPGRLARTLTFLGLVVVVGPLLAAATTQAIYVVTGLRTVDAALRAGPAMVLADAAAIVAIVPAIRTVVARGHRTADASAVGTTTALAAAGAIAGYASVAWSIDGRSLLVMGAVPLLLASLVRQPWVVRLVLVASGTGVAVGLVTGPGPSTVEVQAAFVATAALALVVTALLRTESAGDGDVGRLILGGVVVAGRAEVLARVAATVRHVRTGLGAIVLLEVVVQYRTGWSGEPLPLWVAALGALATLMLANALSLYMDATLGQSRRRQQLESALDVLVTVALHTMFAPLTGLEATPVGVFLALAAISLRVRPREAFLASVCLVSALTALHVADPFPWRTTPDGYTVFSALPLAATALLVVWLISWTSQLLHASREQIMTLAGRLDLTNASMAVATAQREAAYETLEERTAELERASREARTAAELERAARDDYERFAAIVAHDLSSPMATIQGITTTLLRMDLDPETREQLLRSAANSASRAAALVDRLHDHARAGSTALDPAPVAMAEIVADVRADLQAGLTATGSTIECGEDLPDVHADRILFLQLLANLASNSLRHGADDDGVSHVTIDAVEHDGGVTVTVTDRGPGIDPTIAEDLFNVGVRGQRSRGLGLGMATCRTIAERHGGEMSVGPGPDGLGTTVAVIFPAAAAAQRTVLLVEDDDDFRHYCRVRMAQGQTDLDVVEASTVAEAAALLRSGRTIDVALVDVDLPDGNGLDLLADLTRMRIPVQVVTRATNAPAAAAAQAHGLTVMSKSTIAADLDGAGLLRAAAQPRPPAADPQRPAGDPDQARVDPQRPTVDGAIV